MLRLRAIRATIYDAGLIVSFESVIIIYPVNYVLTQPELRSQGPEVLTKSGMMMLHTKFIDQISPDSTAGHHTYRLFNILVRQAWREDSGSSEGLGNRDHV